MKRQPTTKVAPIEELDQERKAWKAACIVLLQAISQAAFLDQEELTTIVHNDVFPIIAPFQDN